MKPRSKRLVLVVTLSLTALGCAAPRISAPDATAGEKPSLFSPTTAITDEWTHLKLNGETQYRMAYVEGRLAVHAVGQDSASGLIRRVNVDIKKCPVLEWSWRVERLQAKADVSKQETEDVGAALYLMFGDPGFLFNPKPVPTLRYIWTNDRHATGAVVDSPYMPGVVRSLVVSSGIKDVGRWITVRRDLGEDFAHVFGKPPPHVIHAFAMFTDNDQTKQPVEAYYGAVHSVCLP